ncbi:MAG TPA: hypothetical protein PKK15_12160 [Kouleothrix sp.]|uniref:hypothetical protein n=1 Tax=Kouleothrix sp. TaxID=2779161 RepID=UPI002B96675D|nr:hypothetical protein [Kouleothrix sp.]
MLDEATLRRLYLHEQRSIRDIAALLGASTRVVYDALIHYRIPRRTAGFRPVHEEPAEDRLDEAMLRRWYLEEERSIRAIADLAQVSTRVVYEALIRYGIPRRTAGQRPAGVAAGALPSAPIDEPTLRRLYEQEGRSIAAIAAALACSPARVRRALVHWGIERRQRGRPGAAPAVD